MRPSRMGTIVVALTLTALRLSGRAFAEEPKSSDPTVTGDTPAAPTTPDTTAPDTAAPDNTAPDNTVPDTSTPQPADPQRLTAEQMGYDDERPLDWPERQWRWYTRHVKPQRFAGRDRDLRYGTSPPFAPYGYYRRNYFGYGYGYGGYAYDPADAYVQGRYDERQFQEWQEHHDKGVESYADAMAEGVRLFRETDYTGAVAAFVRAAELHQGDPASRIHAAYALVAIGNYDDAVLMIRRALQLQSRLVYLPLSIREEYGPKVDFDAHLQRLREATEKAKDDAGMWMLLGYYEHFSGNRSAAYQAVTKAADLAPRDRLIADFHRAVRLQTPSKDKPPR